jgi:SAM-dependent methyltransferase
MSAAQRWKESLALWALPQEIIDQAPESPWIHPAVLFQIPSKIELTPSHQRAIEKIPIGGSILDIGCGGGIAAFAVTPPATHVIGVDHQPEMLEMFVENAQARQVSYSSIEGFWPDVEKKASSADVVTAHHVVYNVGEIVPFLRAMDDHANSRVVIEMPTHHPLSNMADLWKHFWKIDRPVTPTPSDLIAVLSDMGIRSYSEKWIGEMRTETNLDQEARFTRIRLCLPESRESEVREFLEKYPRSDKRELATIWWDKE